MITCPKRSLAIGNWKTSVSLEAAFWDCFQEIAKREGHSRGSLAREIDRNRAKDEKLSNAIRVYILLNVRARAIHAEQRAREGDQYSAELRSTIRAMTGAGEQAADTEGRATIATVIAGARTNA